MYNASAANEQNAQAHTDNQAVLGFITAIAGKCRNEMNYTNEKTANGAIQFY